MFPEKLLDFSEYTIPDKPLFLERNGEGSPFTVLYNRRDIVYEGLPLSIAQVYVQFTVPEVGTFLILRGVTGNDRIETPSTVYCYRNKPEPLVWDVWDLVRDGNGTFTIIPNISDGNVTTEQAEAYIFEGLERAQEILRNTMVLPPRPSTDPLSSIYRD